MPKEISNGQTAGAVYDRRKSRGTLRRSETAATAHRGGSAREGFKRQFDHTDDAGNPVPRLKGAHIIGIPLQSHLNLVLLQVAMRSLFGIPAKSDWGSISAHPRRFFR
jgi:hypothetical protein